MIKFIKATIELIRNPPDPNWHIEKEAKPTKTHPLGGFWKKNKNHEHGLAIGPAEDEKYFISFCGPGGCFEKGAYRQNSTVVGDPHYRILDENTIEVKGKKGYEKYFRVKQRENT